MIRRHSAANAILAGGFGLGATTLGVIFLLIYVGFPFVDTPGEMVTASLLTVLSGGFVIGGAVFVLLQRTILGWNPPDSPG